MKMKQRLNLVTLLVLGLFLSSCVPGAKEGTAKKANCQPGFEFDSTRRVCLATSTPQDGPVGTTTSATLVENSGSNSIAINYTDFHNDPALSCTILSFSEGINDTLPTCGCIAGVCNATIVVDANFSGITDFSYIVTDNDGSSDQVQVVVTVSPINNAPLALNNNLITSENTALLLDFTGLVSDPDGDSISISFPTSPQLGSITPTVNPLIFNFIPNANANDQSFLGEGTLHGIRYVIDPDFNSSTANMTVRYVPSSSLSLGAPIPNLLTVFVVDGVTTDADIKQLLDLSKTSINNTIGLQYEILGSKPVQLGGSIQNLNITNGRDLPDSFTYRVTDSGGLSADATFSVSITSVPSLPVVDPLSQLPKPLPFPENNLVLFTGLLTEDGPIVSFELPYPGTPDRFVDITPQGLGFSLVGGPVLGGVLSNCLGQTADARDLACNFQADPGVNTDNTHAQVRVGQGLRFRALKPGTAGNNISIQYFDDGTNPISVTGVGTTTIQVRFDGTANGGTHQSLDIKNAVLAAMAGAGRPLATPDDFDFEVITLGSVPETNSGPFTLFGGRRFAAEFEYQIANSGQNVVQKIHFDVTPVADIPTKANDITFIAPVDIVLEDTPFSFTANIGADDDIRDNLTYIIDESSLNGEIQNCMGKNSSDLADLTCTFVPDDDFAGTTSFQYHTFDGTSQSATPAIITFVVAATQDPPVLCDYTHFNEAIECGELGCIALNSPIGKVTPSKNGIIFYDHKSGACYISDTALTNKWRRLDPTNATDQGLFVPDKIVNEKEPIVIDRVRVDEGSNDNSTEDTEQVTFTLIESSNTTLIPVGNIKLFYDSDDNGVLDDITAGPMADNGGPLNSADASDMRIVITPVGGQVGSSTIKLTFQDNGLPTPFTSVVEFNVIVNPLSALHGGWTNIKALSPKTNKFDQVKGALNTCNYSRSLCNGECTGVVPPTATPTQTNVLYFDSAANQCYHFPNGGAAWEAINTTCNITPSLLETSCSDAPQSLEGSCIGTAAPAFQAKNLNSFFYDKTNNKCYRSMSTTAPTWQEYTATSEVTIEWKNFTVSGTGSINGFNVYRRLGTTGKNFDYKLPINKTLIPSTQLSYVDNATNSFTAPTPQTVYYYEVRPVLSDGTNVLSTNTTEGFKTIRLMTPPNNKTFVHRWMVNQNICELMQATDIDPLNNYRCSYEGPGDTQLPANTNHYDIGIDMIVDRYEAGCAYSSNKCSTPDGSCIGIGNPEPFNAITNPTGIDADGGLALPGDIYYDRGTGKCYRNVAPNNWDELETPGASFAKYDVAELPPLVHMRQATADNFCRTYSLPQANVLGLAAAALNAQLPTRKMQIAYSQWNGALDDTTVANTEQGLSLNVTSKCNSASASGLSSSYTDTQVPSSNDLFSLPGTATSGIRSMMTGTGALGVSKGTEECSSRYGIQDAVGNVKEWVAERIYCGEEPLTPEPEDNDFACRGMIQDDDVANRVWEQQVINLPSMTNDHAPGQGLDDYPLFRLDGQIGPCNDTDSNGTCDDSLVSWVIDEERFFASRWIIPMGLPAHVEFPNDNPGSVVAPFLKEIGPTSGITATQLHDDKITFNTQLIVAEPDLCGSMAAGGSYQDGTGAGAWSFEYTQCGDSDTTSDGYLINDGFLYRASQAGVTLAIQANGPHPRAVIDVNVAGGAVVVELATNGSGDVVSNSADLIAALRAIAPLDIFVVGDVSNTPSLLSQTPVNNTEPFSRRVDIGFRCAMPIQDGDYVAP